MNQETNEPLEHIPEDMIGDNQSSRRNGKRKQIYSGIGRIGYFLIVLGAYLIFRIGGDWIIFHFMVAAAVGFRSVNMGKSFAWSLVAMIPLVSLIVVIPCFYLKPGHFSEKRIRNAYNSGGK